MYQDLGMMGGGAKTRLCEFPLKVLILGSLAGSFGFTIAVRQDWSANLWIKKFAKSEGIGHNHRVRDFLAALD
jgi:hypothetical protein